MTIVARENMTPQALLRQAAASPAVCWLGQAGFLLRLGRTRVAIDPYLSDSLARKYHGARFPHVRMMPPPIRPEETTPLEFVFCTHAHTDHMDPETLGPLAQVNRDCRFIVPRATAATARSRGVPPERMIAVDAGEEGALSGEIRWHAIASAHETLAADAAGCRMYLGYILEWNGFQIYHSGDCVPYPGLGDTLRRHAVDLAILPVNGRDAERTAAGILGNFSFEEAVGLCCEAAIPALMPCHFGMFEFNTVEEPWLDRQIAALAGPPRCVRPRIGMAYEGKTP